MRTEELKGFIIINNKNITFTTEEINSFGSINGYQTFVA